MIRTAVKLTAPDKCRPDGSLIGMDVNAICTYSPAQPCMSEGSMHRIDTAPFYATREMAESLATSGGLQVNEYSQVLNQSNKPIQGLYAIGNTSGSMFYGTYPHSMNCLSHTRCIVFGYNIGRNLAAE